MVTKSTVAPTVPVGKCPSSVGTDLDGRGTPSQRSPYCCPVIAMLYPEPKTESANQHGSTVFLPF